MSGKPVFTANVKSSGKQIEVYRRPAGGWVEYPNCTTIYQNEELENVIEKRK